MKVALPLVTIALALAQPAAHAESSATSAVSDSASSATSSASNSLGNSSKSSSGDKRVAAGEYRVVQLAALPDQPGMLRAQLRGLDGVDGEFALTLPAVAAERGGLAEGGTVKVMARPFGYAFAKAGSDEAFFLVLDDDWHRELRSRPVVL